LSSGEIKQIATDARVTIYCKEEIPVYANSRLLALHSKEGGDIKVTLPDNYTQVTELYSGKVAARNAKEFTFNFDTPDTRLFELIK